VNCDYRPIVTEKRPLALKCITINLLRTITAAVIISVFFSASFSSRAVAADSLSMPEQLSKLEQSQGYSCSPGQSIIDRLQVLELRTFGNVGAGSIFERLNRLNEKQRALALPSIPAISPNAAQQERIKGLMQSTSLSKGLVTANTFPCHFFRIEEASAKPSNEDYLDSVLTASKNRVFKFQSMPVPVYITAPPDPAYASAVLAAFADWDRRTEGLIKFATVTQPNAARIRVTWSHLGIKPDKDASALGAHTVTKWTKKPSGRLSLLSVGAIPVPLYIPSPGPKYTVPPQLIEVNLDLVENNEAEARYLTLRNIVAHELGHAIGLLGHSPSKGDLMYPITDEHSRISQRDLNTVKKLYEKKATVPL
jgi:hypothetical protein